MSIKNEVIQILDMQPDDPELRELIRDIETGYEAYLTANKQHDQDYWTEYIENRMDQYGKTAKLEKQKYEEMI